MKLSILVMALMLSINLFADDLSDSLNACLKSGVIQKVGVYKTTETRLGIDCSNTEAENLFKALEAQEEFVKRGETTQTITDLEEIASLTGEAMAKSIESIEMKDTFLFFGEAGLSQANRREVLIKSVDGEIVEVATIYRTFIQLDITNELITRLDLETVE